MSSIQNEDILDELDDLFEKIYQIVADREGVDLDFYLKQSNYSLRKAKGPIEAMIAKAERRARIDELVKLSGGSYWVDLDGISGRKMIDIGTIEARQAALQTKEANNAKTRIE